MPQDLPDKLPEDMSDRMPEDLPVRKSTNVMVGITRSKVIGTVFLGLFKHQRKNYRIFNVHVHIYYIHYNGA